MKPRRSIRAAIKWTGAVITGLLLAVWGLSYWYGGGGYTPTIHSYVYAGQLRIGWDEPWSIFPSKLDWHGIYQYRKPGKVAPLSFKWWFNWNRAVYNSGLIRTNIDVPIWFLSVLSGVPTLMIWRGDRRRRRFETHNLCPECGYCRIGLPADRACPECGTAVGSS